MQNEIINNAKITIIVFDLTNDLKSLREKMSNMCKTAEKCDSILDMKPLYEALNRKHNKNMNLIPQSTMTRKCHRHWDIWPSNVPVVPLIRTT